MTPVSLIGSFVLQKREVVAPCQTPVWLYKLVRHLCVCVCVFVLLFFV